MPGLPPEQGTPETKKLAARLLSGWRAALFPASAEARREGHADKTAKFKQGALLARAENKAPLTDLSELFGRGIRLPLSLVWPRVALTDRARLSRQPDQGVADLFLQALSLAGKPVRQLLALFKLNVVLEGCVKSGDFNDVLQTSLQYLFAGEPACDGYELGGYKAPDTPDLQTSVDRMHQSGHAIAMCEDKKDPLPEAVHRALRGEIRYAFKGGLSLAIRDGAG